MNEKNDYYDDNDDDDDVSDDNDDDVSDDNDNCDDENEYGRSPSNGLSSGLNQKLRCCVNTLSVDYMRSRRKRRLLEHTLYPLSESMRKKSNKYRSRVWSSASE